MIDVGSSNINVQQGKLDVIERRLQGARDEDDLRRACVELNQFLGHLRREPTDVRARYSFLRGMLYAKVGTMGRLSFLGPSGECLLYAMDQFADADEALQRCLIDMARPTGGLTALRQTNAYEAYVVLTTLQVWGRRIEGLFTPDRSLLTAQQQKKVGKALSVHYILPSRF